jgi:hypothetical protein
MLHISEALRTDHRDPEPITAAASPRPSLSPLEREELLALLDAHFEGVTSEQFARDLDEKDWVLRLRRGERLVGFTTLQVYGARVDGQSLNVIYSGDTITSPEVWGSPVLARAWIALVRQVQGERLHEPWYWLLLSSGFRTYRFLPVFWREFWPRHDAPMPPAMARLRSRLARQRFGDRYDDQVGVVRFDRPQRLRDALSCVPDGRRHDPHIAFFLEQNPGHDAGDELVCLADLSDANLTAAGQRMLRGSGR